MSEWPSFTIAELQQDRVLLVEDGNHGEYRPRPHEFVEDGTRFIRAADLAEGQVQFPQAAGINDVALSRVRKGIGKPGDILFSHKGTVGKLARVSMDAPTFVCSPQTTFWRVLDESRLRRDYLYAFMRSRAFIDQWWARKGETDMADYVSLTAQRQLRVTVPAVAVQRRIAEPLGAIDDLIENNRRRIELLEQMVQAIYREWFVLFRYPHHEHAALVDSALGPIPEGWELTTCGEALKVLGGGTPSKKEDAYWDGGTIPWYTPSDLTRRRNRFAAEPAMRITEEGLRRSSARLFPAGSVLMTSRATLGVLAIATTDACCNQGFIVIPPDDRWPPSFIYEWLDVQAEALAALGTGATFKEITKGTFKRVPFLVP